MKINHVPLTAPNIKRVLGVDNKATTFEVDATEHDADLLYAIGLALREDTGIDRANSIGLDRAGARSSCPSKPPERHRRAGMPPERARRSGYTKTRTPIAHGTRFSVCRR